MKNKPYYLGERHNPQFKKPYYRMFGQLSKAEVKRKEKSLYGNMYLIPFQTQEEYNTKIAELKNQGYNVYLD